MEWKIGEIKQVNGEWYQCVESVNCSECSLFTTECRSGTKSNLANKVFGQCSRVRRSDNKPVIFKKLEKVGEPYTHYCPSGRIIYFQRYKIFNKLYSHNTEYIICDFNEDGIVSIGLKQTKEDMEENKLNLKPFDLEAAKAGKPVCTRDGRKARIICFDRRLFYKNVSYPILALVERSDGEDDVCGYNEKGKVLIEDGAEYKDDLMMLPERKEGWVNVYRSQIYDTFERATEAYKRTCNDDNYLQTIKISWEE